MRLIDADKAKEEILSWAVDLNNPQLVSKEDILCIIDQQPTIDAEPVKHGRCRCCSPNDCSGLQWDFEDLEVTVTLQCGVLTICNEYGEEAEMPINYCPNCGAKMDLEDS